MNAVGYNIATTDYFGDLAARARDELTAAERGEDQKNVHTHTPHGTRIQSKRARASSAGSRARDPGCGGIDRSPEEGRGGEEGTSAGDRAAFRRARTSRTRRKFSGESPINFDGRRGQDIAAAGGEYAVDGDGVLQHSRQCATREGKGGEREREGIPAVSANYPPRTHHHLFVLLLLPPPPLPPPSSSPSVPSPLAGVGGR